MNTKRVDSMQLRKKTIEESRAIYTSWFKDCFKNPKEFMELEGTKRTLRYNNTTGIEHINIFTYTSKGFNINYVVKHNREILNHKVYDVDIEFEQCTYGNYRFYFKCPSCSMRRTKLYYKDDCLKSLECRECLNLNYRSSQMCRNKVYEIKSKIVDIMLELETKVEYNNLFPNKPKYMRWEKYSKLMQELHLLDSCLTIALHEAYERRGYYVSLTTNQFIEIVRDNKIRSLNI